MTNPFSQPPVQISCQKYQDCQDYATAHEVKLKEHDWDICIETMEMQKQEPKKA